MHQPYQELLRHSCDFVVKYRFFSTQEEGRPAVQGLRFDFKYAHPELNEGGVSMIWPEFEDENGNIILDTTIPIALRKDESLKVISQNNFTLINPNRFVSN